MNAENKKRSPLKAVLIIFALLTLINPNINVIDILPDFIGFFILAKFFEKAANAAPYFEEARTCFLRLAYISLAKIPAFAIIIFARSQNTHDNDIIVLLTICFAALEIIVSIMAAKHIFTALFYLGQRTDASALISSRRYREDNPKKTYSNEKLLSLSIIFFIAKILLYALPELLLLTRTENQDGQAMLVTGSRIYPYVLILALLAASAIGLIWISNIIPYVIAVYRQGKFDSAIDGMMSLDGEESYKIKKYNRTIFNIFGTFIFASFLTIEFTVNNHYAVNIIPHFLFGIVFTIALIRLSRVAGLKKYWSAIAALAGILYIIFAVAFYILQTVFLVKYGYSLLYYDNQHVARGLYAVVCLLSVIEFVLYSGLMGTFAFFLIRFVKTKLGIPSNDPRYSIQDRDYHRSLTKKTAILTLCGLLAGFTKLIGTLLYINSKFITTDSSDLGTPTVIASAIPWFGTVVVAAAIIFITVSIYYFGTIKDDIKG